MSPGPWQIIIIILIILLLFGKGKISGFMADLGRGMKSFKEGLEEESKTKKKKDVPPKEISSKKSVPKKKISAKKETKK